LQHGRVILPAFLTERSARTVLRELYLGIQGSEYNAHLLVSKEPWEIDREAIKGNNLTRRCFIDCIDWLDTALQFALSDDIFREQFQIPFRCAANFIINARGYSSPVTKLTGIVFSKSSPQFSLYFKERMITLGLILP
jgi:hypothetical protein